MINVKAFYRKLKGMSKRLTMVIQRDGADFNEVRDAKILRLIVDEALKEIVTNFPDVLDTKWKM